MADVFFLKKKHHGYVKHLVVFEFLLLIVG